MILRSRILAESAVRQRGIALLPTAKMSAVNAKLDHGRVGYSIVRSHTSAVAYGCTPLATALDEKLHSRYERVAIPSDQIPHAPPAAVTGVPPVAGIPATGIQVEPADPP